MDKKIKRRWLRALRSGKYEQCTGYLHLEGDGFCCLGVLCDVLKKDFKDINWQELGDYPDGESGPQALGFFGSTTVLSDEIINYAGLDENGKSVNININEDSDDFYSVELSDLNDRGESFKEIADIIEEYL